MRVLLRGAATSSFSSSLLLPSHQRPILESRKTPFAALYRHGQDPGTASETAVTVSGLRCPATGPGAVLARLPLSRLLPQELRRIYSEEALGASKVSPWASTMHPGQGSRATSLGVEVSEMRLARFAPKAWSQPCGAKATYLPPAYVPVNSGNGNLSPGHSGPPNSSHIPMSRPSDQLWGCLSGGRETIRGRKGVSLVASQAPDASRILRRPWRRQPPSVAHLDQVPGRRKG